MVSWGEAVLGNEGAMGANIFNHGWHVLKQMAAWGGLAAESRRGGVVTHPSFRRQATKAGTVAAGNICFCDAPHFGSFPLMSASERWCSIS